MTLRLILVRHGLSSFNKEGRIQGRTDLSILTEEGHIQAFATGKALASTGGANTVSATGNIGGSTANATLTSAQLASHSHTSGAVGPKITATIDGNPYYNAFMATSGNTGNQGSGTGHSHNMSATFSGDATSVVQPFLTVIYIIKT